MEKKIIKGMVALLAVSGIEMYFTTIATDYRGVLQVISGFLEAILIYLLILVFGYMYGSGIGCIVGTIAGMLMLVKSGNMTYLGVFCLIGAVTGFFNRLGKLASVMAYFACLWILALLYVPFILEMPWLFGLLIAGMIFMILPVKVVACEESKKEVQGDFEGTLMFSRQRIGDVADIFHRLAEGVLRINREADTVFATGLQLREAAGILDRISESMFVEYVEPRPKEEEMLQSALEKKGYVVNNIRLLKGHRGESSVEVILCNSKGTETTKEAAGIISGILGKPFKVADCCRTIVNKEFSNYKFVEEPEFMMLHAIAMKTKSGEEVSGDNFTCTKFGSGEVLLGIVDGMGSGAMAGEESEMVIELLEDLLKAGFDDEAALNLINSMLITRNEERSLAAIDMAVGDLYTGRFNFVKLGAAATFIKRNRWVETLKSTNYPMGILKDVDYENVVKKLYDGDYIVMVSDGILDAVKGDKKEEVLSGWIADYNKKNPKEFAKYILDRAVSESEGVAKDDMTVLVAGIWAKKS